MLRIAAGTASVLLVGGLLAAPPSLAAQGVDNPIVPRGHILFEMFPSTTTVESVFTSDGRRSLGALLTHPELGVAQLPELAGPEDRFRELTGDAQSRIHLGGTRGQVTADEQVLPFRIGYGLLDRVTVGVTIPFVRRRVDSQLRLVADGTNVGLNPATQRPMEVTQFLAGFEGALATAEAEVEEACAQEGEESARCTDGRTLLADAAGFLDALAGAYDTETLFPLRGSNWGDLLAGRWTRLRTGLAEWNAEGPEFVPLATSPLTSSEFREHFVTPRWGADGFPSELPDAFLELGDVEAHVAVGLLDRRPPEGGGLGIRSALIGTVRFATGAADSLRTVATFDPPRGVPGVQLRSVTDVIVSSRFAALSVVELGWNGSRDVELIDPGPAGLFGDAPTRLPLEWSPGGQLRIEFTPRVLLGSALSLGAGYHLVHRGEDSYSGEGAGGVVAPGSTTIHRGAAELRYTAFDGPVSVAAPFAFELMARVSGALAGKGPVDRRVELGVRVKRRR